MYLVLIIDAVVKLSCGLYLAERRLCRHAEVNEMFRCLAEDMPATFSASNCKIMSADKY